MENFRCETDAMLVLIENLRIIQGELEESLTEAVDVWSEIETMTEWSGDAALAGFAFLDLVIKYHTLLAGGKEEGPVTQACKGLEEYMYNDGTFYSEWYQYQVIKEM